MLNPSVPQRPRFGISLELLRYFFGNCSSTRVAEHLPKKYRTITEQVSNQALKGPEIVSIDAKIGLKMRFFDCFRTN